LHYNDTIGLFGEYVFYRISSTILLYSNNLKSKTMKTMKFAIGIIILLMGGVCFSQPGNNEMKLPSIEERLKMVDKEICQTLKLDKSQTEKVTAAFKDFFFELDKNVTPPARPEKAKADALAKVRDEKVKQAIPAALYPKYLELEKATRPKGPEEGKP
jgi:hypothetical protein